MPDRGAPVYPLVPGDAANELIDAEPLGGLRARRQKLPELARNKDRDVLSLAAGDALREREQGGAHRVASFLPRDPGSPLDQLKERLFTHTRWE